MTKLPGRPQAINPLRAGQADIFSISRQSPPRSTATIGADGGPDLSGQVNVRWRASAGNLAQNSASHNAADRTAEQQAVNSLRNHWLPSTDASSGRPYDRQASFELDPRNPGNAAGADTADANTELPERDAGSEVRTNHWNAAAADWNTAASSAAPTSSNGRASAFRSR